MGQELNELLQSASADDFRPTVSPGFDGMGLSDLQERVICAFLLMWSDLVHNDEVPEDVATLVTLMHLWNAAEPPDREALLQHPDAQQELEPESRFHELICRLASELEDRLEEVMPAEVAEA